MIPLVLAQVAARWGQALTVLVLSLAATAAAVSAPVYADAVDRAAIAREIAAASADVRVVSLPSMSLQAVPFGPDPFAAAGEVLAELADFTPVVTRQLRVQGLPDEVPADVHRLQARDGFCRHVVFRAGRCPVGDREAALPAALAGEAGRGAGDQVELTPVLVGIDGSITQIGPPAAITLVGVFEAEDPTDPYWAAGQWSLGHGALTPAILTLPTTLAGIEHDPSGERAYFAATLRASALTPERIPALRDQVDAANDRIVSTDLGSNVVTDLPVLLAAVAEHGNQARALLPVTAAPLLALCWLVVYLAVSHGVFARRHEAGVVVLRGAKPRTRSVMVAAETLVPVLAGIPVGVLAAYLLVALAGPAPARVTVDTVTLAAAGLAAAGTVLAALLALRRALAAPVAQLLRRVPPRRRAAAIAAEVLAVGLAVVAVADLRVADQELAGVAVVAPAMVMLAVAVLAARALRPAIELVGGWALRRGRLGPALAARYLARRPGAARLTVVLALVLGMLGFAVAGADVAAQGRATEAARDLGAARVLSVQVPEQTTLLSAVRAADPEGRYAMAVVQLPGGSTEPPALAVDATRLAEVAAWSPQYGQRGPAEVAELLRPPAVADPVLVGDGELAAELTLADVAENGAWTVSLALVPATGGSPVAAVFGPLTSGQRTYRDEVTGCGDPAAEGGGCRLAGLVVTPTGTAFADEGLEEVQFGVTWHALRREGAEVLAADLLADRSRWRTPYWSNDVAGIPLDFSAPEEGLVVTHQFPFPGQSYQLLVLDTPYPVPVVTGATRISTATLSNVDGEPVEVVTAAGLPGLPGLAGGGVLMDLEYAERSTSAPGPPRSPRVWLAAGTPEEVVERLRAEGLTITGEQDTATAQAVLDQSGAALALRFFLLAGGVAVLVGLLALGLVVGVDRGGWRASLRQLRAQGVAGRTVGRAVRWSYGSVVLAATVAGALAVGAAWLTTRDRLPLGIDPAVVPPWPRPAAVLAPWAAVVAVLFAAAVVAARWQRVTATRQGGD